MRNNTADPNKNATCVSTRDDAVGIPSTHWFIAIVRSNSEAEVGRELSARGFKNFVAAQSDVRLMRNGQKKTVNRILIRSKVFVKCTEAERRQIVTLPFISRFMSDRAGTVPGKAGHPLATIPDSQMDSLMFMLGNSESPVSFSQQYFSGDKVRVARGKLRNLEGEVISCPDGSQNLVIRVDLLGSASVIIDPADVIKL